MASFLLPGSLIRGTLRVSSSKTSMAFVRPDGAKSQDREWVVRGSNYRNRAVHGDVVIIQPILYGRTEERGFAKMVLDFFSMKNMYCENLSEKRIKARRGTTAIIAFIISTGWCFGEKLFPSSWQTRHPHPNKDPYCLTPFSLKHLGIVVTESWFLHRGPLPVINGVRTRLLTPVTHFKSPFIEVISPLIFHGRGPSCETCLLPNILQRILWSKWIRNQLHSVSANRNFWEW